MKRIISVLAAALLMQAVGVFAQDSDEPSIQSVLDAARAKYRAAMAEALDRIESQDRPDSDPAPQEAEDSTDEAAEPAPAAAPEAQYTPILLSLVPGVSIPFGYYDASIAAGGIGVIARDITGVAGSGVFNLLRNARGAVGAGVFNIVGDVAGVQGAGVFNIANGSVRGGQGAGVFNIAGQAQGAIQGAGVFNIASDLRGVQGAGVFNIATEIRGVQAAGLFNITTDVTGLQAAGVFNSAKRVKGVQAGIVNVAGHIDGVQLGLINIAGNGVDSIGATYEPATGYGYAIWQAGTPALYTIATYGAPISGWSADFSGGIASFGLGSRARLFGLTIDVDLSAAQFVGNLPFDSIAMADCDWSAAEWQGWSMMRPYPSIRVAASLGLGRHWRITGGLKADVDAAPLGDRVPEALKVGSGRNVSALGIDFTLWPKWFFGISF